MISSLSGINLTSFSSAGLGKLESAIKAGNANDAYSAAVDLMMSKKNELAAAVAIKVEEVTGVSISDITSFNSVYAELSNALKFDIIVNALAEMFGFNLSSTITGMTEAQKAAAFIAYENATAGEFLEWFAGLPFLFEGTAGSPAERFMYAMNAFQTGDEPSAAAVTAADEMIVSTSTLIKIFGWLILSRKASDENFRYANLSLVLGPAFVNAFESGLTSGSNLSKLISVIGLLDNMGVTGSVASLPLLQAVLNSEDAITTLAFKTALATFLESIWPGLASELSISP